MITVGQKRPRYNETAGCRSQPAKANWASPTLEEEVAYQKYGTIPPRLQCTKSGALLDNAVLLPNGRACQAHLAGTHHSPVTGQVIHLFPDHARRQAAHELSSGGVAVQCAVNLVERLWRRRADNRERATLTSLLAGAWTLATNYEAMRPRYRPSVVSKFLAGVCPQSTEPMHSGSGASPKPLGARPASNGPLQALATPNRSVPMPIAGLSRPPMWRDVLMKRLCACPCFAPQWQQAKRFVEKERARTGDTSDRRNQIRRKFVEGLADNVFVTHNILYENNLDGRGPGKLYGRRFTPNPKGIDFSAA
jgi:hypothetical protein